MRPKQRLTCLFLLLSLSELLWAQADAEYSTDNDLLPSFDAEDDLGDELILFEDIPIVVTAARAPQPINLSSQAISIVTSEDIRLGGYTSIPEMLQFVPGVDILQIDRNNVALGVRGLHHQFADRTLVLINGRDATSPVFGGTDFYRLPVFPADIEQIEVVRGPGGAAWGANAFNGVVNIITKKPEDVLGVFSSATVNEFGDTFTHVRWAEKVGGWSWRLSAGYEDRESSEDAIDDDDFSSRDFGEDWRVNGELIRKFSDKTKLEIGSAFIHVDRGDFEFAGYPGPGDPRGNEHIDNLNFYTRLDHEFENGWSGFLQVFTNYEDVDRPSLWKYFASENDIEGQLGLPLSDTNELLVGGNARWVHIDADRKRPTDLLEDADTNEYWAGFFLIDRWDLTDDLVLEGQGRVDWYSETEVDWSGRLTALYSLDEKKQHVVRLSAARAFRAPSLAIREASTSRVPLPPPVPPGNFLVNLLEPGDLDNEEIYSVEAGYTGLLREGLQIEIVNYYQRYEDLIGPDFLPDPFGFGRFFTVFDDIGGGNAFGTEVEVSYKTEDYAVSSWYAYNYFDTDSHDQGIRAFLPARNKAGISGRVFLPYGVIGNLNYKYVDSTRTDPSDVTGGSVPRYHRLDLSISAGFAGGKGTFTLGVWDVLDETDLSIQPIGALTAHDTPGRTVFVQAQLNLGS